MKKVPQKAVTVRQMVGGNIRALRKQRGWTQIEVRDRLADFGWETIGHNTFAETEAGKRDISVDELYIFSRLFGVPVERFFLPDEEQLHGTLVEGAHTEPVVDFLIELLHAPDAPRDHAFMLVAQIHTHQGSLTPQARALAEAL